MAFFWFARFSLTTYQSTPFLWECQPLFQKKFFAPQPELQQKTETHLGNHDSV
ncbi:hypothetical protein PL9631_600016 [Planktothrix paucivesiculata PCC 9631]|uniref:Uncharacterized protein n=1 Tax=Planktothrix paucivesiculata PCC 9631 TaxID=671071 RepID=A0A7Z9BSF6_9CYAN|nr:hypothetical protein PL9631_600016 [Planktothrix paucivesiculata PCC 9631]